MRSVGRGTAGTAQGTPPSQMPLWTDREAVSAWNVRISRRARRMAIRVFPGGRVEVVVPAGAGLPAVERFVARHRDWAERRAHELRQSAPVATDRQPSQVRLELLGREWTVEYAGGARRQVTDIDGTRLRVQMPQVTERQVAQTMIPWLTRLASHELSQRLRPLAQELGIDYARMSVRRQRTRWGSCSTQGTISLNVCLLFQSPAVVRYLMVHELCHRRHMNHSRRFWALVESIEPECKQLDAELLQGWRKVPAWVFP